MKRSTTLLAAFATLLFTVAAQANGVEWGYSVDRDRPAVEADVPGTGGITLTNELFRTARGDSDIVLTSLSTFSSASFEKPDTFTNAPYALTLTLTDMASGVTGSLVWTGQFSGILSRSYAQIANDFTGLAEQAITLGKNTYRVVIGPYVPPPIPGASNNGSIGARVYVTEGDNGGGGGIDTPEPSTMVLAGLGLSFLGLSSLRKRRQAA